MQESPRESSGPSIFTALQEQLGLKKLIGFEAGAKHVRRLRFSGAPGGRTFAGPRLIRSVARPGRRANRACALPA